MTRLQSVVLGLKGWRRLALAFGLGALATGALPPAHAVILLVPAFSGLLGIRVPPGVDAVQVRYRPVMVMLATALAWVTLIAGFAALIVLRRAGRRSAPVSAEEHVGIRD